MGRWPFVCAYRRYLKGMRAKLSNETIAERERKLHYLSKIETKLHESGVMSTTNPSKFTEDDVIELVVALKDTDTSTAAQLPDQQQRQQAQGDRHHQRNRRL